MDDDMQAIEVRDREIERRLDAYARARLSPDRKTVARTRARVMREARLRFEAARIAAHMAPSASLLQHRSTTRRLAMPFLAASIWLGIAVGSIAAAQAGGPLYSTRMWIENATLPTAGAARANAELDRLDARLFEAFAAASRGDVGAVEAALDAYFQIADEATAAAIGDSALEDRVAAALDKHLAVLAAVAASLEGQGNDTAVAAVEASIQRAIVHNKAVVDRLDANGTGDAVNGSTGGPAASPGGASGAGTAPGASVGTGGGSGTGATPSDGKPDKTPKPTAAPPDPQGPPEHSPRGPSQ
jgi:hypothetical protein